MNRRCKSAARLLLDDFRAGDVRRHQVGRELNAAERQIQRARERADHQRLGQTRHALQQTVPAAEDTDQQFVDHILLADNHFAKLLPNVLAGRLQFVDRTSRYGLVSVTLDHAAP